MINYYKVYIVTTNQDNAAPILITTTVNQHSPQHPRGY